MNDSPAVELVDVRFRYPDGRAALDGFSLRVDAGERVAVLGPNGAGKSTFCLHLNGILTPHHGSVRVCGLDVDRGSIRQVRRRVGVVFQDPDDMLFMPTVEEDIAFGPANLGLPAERIRDRVDRSLAMVGMTGAGDRSPHHLSFGQRKRVATATVLSMEPDILVLDEPSSNLDPRGRREFGEILQRLEQTLIMVTHDLPYAWQLCDRAVVIDDGHVVADGPIADLMADPDLLRTHDLELPEGFDPRIVSSTRSPRP